MAQPANSFSTNDAVGIREDLTDMIHMVEQMKTPFMQMCAKTKATNTLHEWQTDELAAASDSNAVVEGNDTTVEASTPTARLGNYCQISEKSARVTGTQNAVNTAGRATEMAYQVMKRLKELRRDMESSLLANKARVSRANATAGVLAGVPAWIKTNTSAGSGGSDPTGDGTDARTDGTQRAFTESLLKNVIKQCYDEGGEPTTLMVGTFNKQAVSGFTGGATRNVDAKGKALHAAVDIYVSDFGTLRVVPNTFMRARDALLLEKDKWCVAYLRPVKQKELAVTGDSEARLINVEYTMEAKNEKASGGAFDLTTS